MALGSRRTLEVVALVELARLQSPSRLIYASSEEGLLHQRHVKLDVLMDGGALTGDQERLEERKHAIHCSPSAGQPNMSPDSAWNACRRRGEA